MKICKIIIKDFQQFQDFELDLTHPATGEPLDKVCLIGSNGTGKSTLLDFINMRILYPHDSTYIFPFSVIKYKIDSEFFYSLTHPNLRSNYRCVWFNSSIDKVSNWIELFASLNTSLSNNIPKELQQYIINPRNHKIGFEDNNNHLLIHSPSEGSQNLYKNISNVPKSSLNEALGFFGFFPSQHTIAPDTINDFWKILIYLIKKRENDFREFQNKEENLDKTIRQVQEEFDKISPKILTALAQLWDKILDKAGLEFDVENASNPIQLNDNLQAYIKLKGTEKNIPYNQLSTGIRNFIFRVGHIFTLYFNRKIKRGFLLLDEPENSLHPDFLYDLIDIYTSIIQNTQFITATHNPIIAAQFEPYERFILEFDEHGAVHAKRGYTPIGDDPNDLLVQDFGVRNLYGKEGVKKWDRYIELKELIQNESDKAKKVALLEEFMSIGHAYNFPLK